jgi:hypothetical protein
VIYTDETALIYTEFKADSKFVEQFNSENCDVSLVEDNIIISSKTYNKFAIEDDRIINDTDSNSDLVFSIKDNQFSNVSDSTPNSSITVFELQNYDYEKATNIYSIKVCLFNKDNKIIGIRECRDDDEVICKDNTNIITFKNINNSKFVTCSSEKIDHYEILGGIYEDNVDITDLT